MECAGHRVDTTSQQFEFACEMQTKRKIDTIYFSPKFTTAFISIIFIRRVSIVGGILLPQNIQKWNCVDISTSEQRGPTTDVRVLPFFVCLLVHE